MLKDDPADEAWLSGEAGNCGAEVICMDSLEPVTYGSGSPTLATIGEKKGWALDLNSQEQVVTSAITIFGVVTFSTHEPAEVNLDPKVCTSSLGIARVYNIGYANAGLLKDITADLDADGGAWRDTFAPGALGVYAYKGQNYGVPWDMGMIGFWYNKDLFAQAGIDAPPTTWAELLEDVKALKAAGITPIALGEGDKWPGMHMWAYLVTRLGGKDNFEGALLRTVSFTDEPFVQAGVMIQELVALAGIDQPAFARGIANNITCGYMLAYLHRLVGI